jgi:hypothetical protein
MPLRARKNNKISLRKNAKAPDTGSSLESPSDSKGHRKIEREIEGIWHKSAKLSWSFAGFAKAMLEVLTVLHERDKMKTEKGRQETEGK